MMLKYSMSASNTFDMLRILEGKGKETAGLASLGNGIKDQINQMKTDIRNGKNDAQEKGNNCMYDVTQIYFSKDNIQNFLDKKYKRQGFKCHP